MASPQKENGFTSIANELLVKIYQSSFSLRELRIILAVMRFTYGFQRKSAQLSISFLSQATKIPLRHVQFTVKNLISKNVLIVVNEFRGLHSRKIKLNKNYDCWELVLTDSVNTKKGLVMTNPVNTSDTDSDITKPNGSDTDSVITSDTDSDITSDDQSGHPRKKTRKKTLKKRSSFSIKQAHTKQKTNLNKEERAHLFAEKVYSKIGYPKDELGKFIEYWTESGEKQKELRFEMEKVFDINRRLKTWFQNKEKWNSQKIKKDDYETIIYRPA